MQGSKTPTLSIGPKKTKVFGRPPDGSSVTSESNEQAPPKPAIQINSSKPRTPVEKKKRQSKIPSLVVGSASKQKPSTMNSEPVNKDFSDDTFVDNAEQDSASIKAQSVMPVSPKMQTNTNRRRSNASNISASNRSVSGNRSVSSQQSRQKNIPPPPPKNDPYPVPLPPAQNPAATTSTTAAATAAPQNPTKEEKLNDIHDYSIKDYDEYSESPAKGEYSFTDSPGPNQKKEKAEDYPNVSVLPTVAQLLEDEEPTGKIGESANSLDDWQQNLLQVASPIEAQHQKLWFNSLMAILTQQNLGVDKNKISFYDNLVSNARDFIKNHRFSQPGGTSHRFKVVVTGPSRSGKSTFLSIISQQYLLDLLASGDWKTTFVFPIDTALFAPYFEELGSLYTQIVQLTFASLAIQRPLLVPYIDSLTHSFQTVVSGVPLLPKNFLLDEDFRLIVPAVQQLLDIITQCWRDPTAMMSFAVNAFMFPYFVANIFGFTKFTVIADHFDLSDVTKTPGPPFIDSTENIFLAELFKFMINEASYIVSGKNSAALVDLLSTVDIQSKGYSQCVESISTLNIVEPSDDDACNFNIAFEGDEPPIQLTAKYLGGCPFYHLKWREINIMAQQISDKEEEEEDAEEDRLALINLIQALLKQIMISSDGTPYNLSIKSVTPFQSKKQE